MPVTSQGSMPAGFQGVFRVKPQPDAQGIIHGDSPLTVKFDVCGSKTDADKTLTYLYDWDFDHEADVVGTGDACQQEHRYDVRRFPDAQGDVLFETNVCVVSGDLRTPNAPGTFYSCRTFRISLPVPRQACAHDLCTIGAPLSGGCNQCVASICAVDSFCCNKGWDNLCVREVSSVCGLTTCFID